MSTHSKAADATRDTRISDQLRLVGLSLRVRLRRGRIDRDLAEDRVRGRSEEHTLRVAQLTSPAGRREIARSWREIVVASENPRAELLGSTALLNRDAVVPLRDELTRLAQRLEQTGPIGPCGIARARVLACDGMGPLYNSASERSLREALAWTTEGLDMSPWNGAHRQHAPGSRRVPVSAPGASRS